MMAYGGMILTRGRFLIWKSLGLHGGILKGRRRDPKDFFLELMNGGKKIYGKGRQFERENVAVRYLTAEQVTELKFVGDISQKVIDSGEIPLDFFVEPPAVILKEKAESPLRRGGVAAKIVELFFELSDVADSLHHKFFTFVFRNHRV
jgi:hypothetical protein